MSTVPLLEVTELVKHFPVKGTNRLVRAVDGVSFELAPGETLSVVGESGCGKSTLARSVLRLIEPSTGSIFFKGENLMLLGPRELRERRRDMQIIFQDPYASLDARQNVRSIIEEPLAIHNVGTKAERRRRVNQLLELVGLPADAAERFPHEFSGGQRQRIGIARAVALEPKLVVADEPVSALDVSIQSQILNLMVELKLRLGLSYIFISHDLAVVKHISDVVAVMYLGRIVELAQAEDIFATPRHPYARALLSAIPRPEVGRPAERTILTGDIPDPSDPPPGCRFHPRCPEAMPVCREKDPLERVLGKGPRRQRVWCHLY